jgi:hypothetical protein
VVLTLALLGGLLVGAVAFLAQSSNGPPLAKLPIRTEPPEVASPVPNRAAPGPRAIRPVRDSLIVLPADGRWTRAVPGGGAGYQASFLPEEGGANYRVKVDNAREVVLLDQPGFRGVARTGGTFRFSSLTGAPVRLRFSRWRTDAPAGTIVHATHVVAPAGGAWGARVWFGPLRITWDPDRGAGYEVRTSLGRVFRVPAGVRSVALDPLPEWIQFRGLDSALTVMVTYSVP